MVMSCLLITLIKCLKGHKSLGSLCSVVFVIVFVFLWVRTCPFITLIRCLESLKKIILFFVCQLVKSSVSESVSQSVIRSPIELFWTAKNRILNNTEGIIKYLLFFWRNIAFVVVDHRRRGDVEETEHLMFYPRRRTRFSWEFSTCSNVVLKILKSRSWLLWLVPTCLLRPISLSNLGG